MTFLFRHWFLIALAVVLSAGMAWPAQLAPLVDGIPRSWLVASVMFLMALPLPLAQLTATVRNSGPAWLAVAINSGLAPILGWSTGSMLPTALAAGMIVATSVPCTMASAAVWTRRGGGNEATVLLVTIITSLSCFLVLPAWLWLLLSAHVSLDFSELSQELLLRVVLPILAAQVVRQVPPIGAWATAQRVALSTTSQIGILLMVLMGVVSSSQALATPDLEAPTPLDWFLLLASVIGVHCILLWLGWRLSRWLGFSYAETLAVALAGSQKTLPVGLEVAPHFGGLAVLPIVVYHVTQLVIDTVLIERMRDRPGLASSPSTDLG